jgi:hypothetical protein
MLGLGAIFTLACGSDGGSSGSPGVDAGSTSSCADVCLGVMSAQCPSGPPTQEECVKGCETIRSGPCAAEYQALRDCAGSNPTYACTASGTVTVTGCESENTVLSSCLASS